MSSLITKDNIESVFKEEVNGVIQKNGLLTTETAFEKVIDFFNTKISEVDISIVEHDMLFIEYGNYDWEDGKGENFTIDIVREFYINTIFQLHLMLYFNKSDFNGFEAGNKWSVDFDNIEDWQKTVRVLDVYKNSMKIEPKEFDIYLIETGN